MPSYKITNLLKSGARFRGHQTPETRRAVARARIGNVNLSKYAEITINQGMYDTYKKTIDTYVAKGVIKVTPLGTPVPITEAPVVTVVVAEPVVVVPVTETPVAVTPVEPEVVTPAVEEPVVEELTVPIDEDIIVEAPLVVEDAPAPVAKPVGADKGKGAEKTKVKKVKVK